SVVQVRLPRSGEAQPRPASGTAINPLAETRLDRLHQRGYRGQGVKVVVVAAEFDGYKKLLLAAGAPPVHYIDFTTPREPSLEPKKPAEEGPPSQGTLAALAVRLAAPGAELILVRVDPLVPNEVLFLARVLNEPD